MKRISYSGSRTKYNTCEACNSGSDAFCYCANVIVNTGKHSHIMLNPHLEIVNHSPTGFEWGYAGSGPAQLAFAILYDLTQNKELALDAYQQFKMDFIARISDNQWEIMCDDIQEWIEQRRK